MEAWTQLYHVLNKITWNPSVEKLGPPSRTVPPTKWAVQRKYCIFLSWNITKKIKYKQINKFPVSNRDISFIIENSTISESILKETLNYDLIKAIKVIDIYTDESLGENKKSLTVRVTYGSDHKTLSGQEIDECEKVFLSNLSKKISFDIRA